MTIRTHRTALLLTALLAAGAQAQTPATTAAPQATTAGKAYSAIDPNTFILGHPASPRWQVVHANQAHPAVRVALAARGAAVVDANTFIVQPPASVTWLAEPATVALVAIAKP